MKSILKGATEDQEQPSTIEEIQAASELISVGYTQDAYAAVKAYGVQEVHLVVAEVKQAIKAGRNGAKPIYNPGGFTAARLKERIGLAKVKAELFEQGIVSPGEPEIDVEGVAADTVALFEAYRRETASRIWDAFDDTAKRSFIASLESRLDRFQADLIKQSKLSGKSLERLRDAKLLDDYNDRHLGLHDFIEHEGLLANDPTEVKLKIIDVVHKSLS